MNLAYTQKNQLTNENHSTNKKSYHCPTFFVDTPFSQSTINFLPYKWVFASASFANTASSTLSYCTNAKPRCDPSIFFGNLIVFIEPNSLNNSSTSFLLAWNAKFLIDSFEFFSQFWVCQVTLTFIILIFSWDWAFFLDIETTSLWPSRILFWRFLRDFWASSCFQNSTKPQPIDLPSLDLTILAYFNGPIFSKNSYKEASSLSKLRFLTQTTLQISSQLSISSLASSSFLYTSSSVNIPTGAYSRYKKLFLNLWYWSFSKAFLQQSGFKNSTIAIDLLGAKRILLTIPQNSNNSLKSFSFTLWFKFLTRRIRSLLSHRALSFYMKSRLSPYFFIQSLVYWMTYVQARATLGARFYDIRIQALVTLSFLATLSRIVLGLRKSVFQFVVSLSFCLISLFFFFLYEVFSSSGSGYFSLIFCSKSAYFPFLIICPTSSSAGLT